MTDATQIFAQPRQIARARDCTFYHVMDLPGTGLVGDLGFDLRPRLDDYLGGVDFGNRRVLEIGPASGCLTFHMENLGAEVVAVELGPATTWDVVPQAALDPDGITRTRLDLMEQLRNGFWFARGCLGGTAQVHYGSAYELPPELGRFDIALIACVLLHTRDPLRVIENCARVTDDKLVIVERHWPELAGTPVMQLVPTQDNEVWDTWWSFSPELIAAWCGVLGFAATHVGFHEQRLVWPGGGEAQIPMFTVVAERGPGHAEGAR